MRIALCQPPPREDLVSSVRELGVHFTIPLGIATVAACLESRGHSVRIFDGFYSSSWLEDLLSFRPVTVCISCNFSGLHSSTLNLLGEMRERKITTILGGHHAHALFDLFLHFI